MREPYRKGIQRHSLLIGACYPLVSTSYLSVSVIIRIRDMEDINLLFCAQMDSRMHGDNLEKVLRAAIRGCHDVFGILNRTVRDHVEQHVGILDSKDI